MKIVLIGGHLSPLLSIIEALPLSSEVLVLGRKYAMEGDSAFSLEYRILQENKINFKEIKTGRLQRRITKYTLYSLFKIPYGFFQSLFILAKFKPDFVLSFGGYISLPVTIAALFLNIPVVIHEQTLEAGLTNKFVALFAKKVCISWKTSEKFFPRNKTVLTGNPIRQFQISNFKYQISNKLPLIYITGGSNGSHGINLLVEGSISKLLDKYIVFHQTGDAKNFLDFDRLSAFRENLPRDKKERYILRKFVETNELGSIYKKADLVISRSGINTITELIFFGKPSLLIPLPFSQNQEQLKNAKYFKNLGLGEVLDQENTTQNEFYEQINYMYKNLDQYRKKRMELQDIIKPDAARNIVQTFEADI